MAYRQESSLEAAGALATTTSTLGSITNPPWGAGWSCGSVVVIWTLLSDQIPNCLVPHSVIEFQLLCSVMIESALVVGMFFSFPRISWKGKLPIMSTIYGMYFTIPNIFMPQKYVWLLKGLSVLKLCPFVRTKVLTLRWIYIAVQWFAE